MRAQCKTGRLRNGRIEFATRSVRVNTTGWFTQDYSAEADIFLVYWAQGRRIYAVPVDEAPATQMWLRLEPTRNGQRRGIHLAEQYELPE
jgi:hypothetical protein